MSIQFSQPLRWHPGEIYVHQALNIQGLGDFCDAATSKDDSSIEIASSKYLLILGVMPIQHQKFFSNLSYVAFGTLDDRGRPWVSILTGKPGFISSLNSSYLAIVTDINPGDPLDANLKNGMVVQDGTTYWKPFAAVGVDFSNRRQVVLLKLCS